MTEPKRGDDLVQDAKEEIVGMAKQGMHHPSTKPVLIAGAVGAAAGFLLPVLTIPVGLAIGAVGMFYKRIRP